MTFKDHQHCAKNWPALDPKRDGVTHPENLRKRLAALAGLLEERLQELAGEAEGSAFDLQAKADLSMLQAQLESIERWGGGQDLSGTLRAGHRELTTIYHQVNQRLRDTIALIGSAGGVYHYATDATLNDGRPV
ncbi:hypothetical protein FH608_040605 [Nonomuraea phyllanthi]|uniref:Uncharacterized protein n=1 Tax=Nonomuraea phyllanthi TaxID=2219224 RepID=A0A5C4VIY7_9ACTN|nr:hypothetical protein [Nonomuraea phyllanthi]KAB8189148.1 hypothetical protein FH608_040605 [Nonomuraea phyllanthi]QFY10239.1 hypothetical protein GBF35_29640 [Nonomuraea phyllanthi]